MNMPCIRESNYWQWELSVKSLNNWVCRLAQSVTTGRQYTLVEPVKTEGD
nr:MAG TPA: hypothetical protein [Caudoviricetes sp.]